tara:strand:- start:118 stop:390 length:273 start_codon:yes stop_codon:yes gene_type:complete
MEEPEFILKNGTKVKVIEELGAPTGILIKEETLARRTAGVSGQICGWVPGHGGDVYWVRHNGEENTGSAYGWWEFELEENLTDDPRRATL